MSNKLLRDLGTMLGLLLRTCYAPECQAGTVEEHLIDGTPSWRSCYACEGEGVVWENA